MKFPSAPHGALPALMVGALFTLAATVSFAQTVTMGLGADIRSINPGVDNDDATDGVVQQMVEGLVGYRENGEVAPLLAQSYAASSDGLTYTFKLRPGVKFHNGAALTSADVLWSWKHYLDPKTGWSCLGSFDGRVGVKITEVVAPDASTFVMKLDRRSATFLTNMAQTDCGGSGIYHRDSVQADGSWKELIGTGPFKMKEWRRNQFIDLERFDDYISPPGNAPDGYVGNKKPTVKQARYLIVPDLATMKAALTNGQVDAANIPETDIQEMTATGKVQIFTKEVKVRRSMVFNTTDPVLKNKKIRQAIAAALNIDEVVAAASNNVSKPNNSMIYAGSPYYSAVQKTRLTNNVELAKKLLKEGGYAGQPISIVADKRPTVPLYNVALISQQMLAAAGINAKLEVVDFANLISRYVAGNFQMLAISYPSRMDPSLAYNQAIGTVGSTPFRTWTDEPSRKLLQESYTELDPAKRQVLFDELHKIQIDEVPVIVLYNGVQVIAVNKRLSSFDPWEFKPRMWTARLVGK